MVRGLVLMMGLAAIAWALGVGVAHFGDAAWIDTSIRDHGWLGLASYLGLGAIAVAAGLPRQVASFAAGYAFGFVRGTLWALVASLSGCVIAFFYARLLARAILRRRFPERVRRLDAFLKQHPISMTILVRFLPVTNNLLTNLAAGVSSVPPAPFLLGSLVGYLPQTLIFALLGSGTRIEAYWRIIASVILFLASTLVGALLYRRRGRAAPD